MPLISTTLADQVVSRRRAEVLDRIEWFPARDLSVGEIETAVILDRPEQLAARIGKTGVGVFRLTRPLTVPEFVRLAEYFGEPEPETDDSLMDRVDERVVLNLVPDVGGPITEQNQPFSPSPLTFHIEGSRRPRGTAPSFLLFQCLQPSPWDQGSQTVLRSVDGILDGLSADALEVLGTTVLGPGQTDAPIVYEHDGLRRLNFRDPWPQPYDLASTYDEKDVLQSLTELLVALYDSEATVGVPWQRDTLAIIDNRRWLHGRTQGFPGDRHLQRIRVKSLDQVDGAA